MYPFWLQLDPFTALSGVTTLFTAALVLFVGPSR